MFTVYQVSSNGSDIAHSYLVCCKQFFRNEINSSYKVTIEIWNISLTLVLWIGGLVLFCETLTVVSSCAHEPSLVFSVLSSQTFPMKALLLLLHSVPN